MKKLFIILFVCVYTGANAGGFVTNGNQSASYIRTLSREASTETDAVFYNPAGLMGLEDGLSISINNQFLWQTRTITDNHPALNNSEFNGKMQTVVFPGIYAAYKTGDWAFSLGFNPTAGGGSVRFDDGMPMLEVDVAVLPGILSSMGLKTNQYSMESMMDGRSVSFGYQAGITYKISEHFGIYGGGRLMQTSNHYEAYLRNIKLNPQHPLINPDANMIGAYGFFVNSGIPALAAAAPSVADQKLDVQQKGIGVTSIVGVHYRNSKLNIGVKYEANTNLSVTNHTKSNAYNMFPDGQKLRADIPAMISAGLSYDFVPQIKMSFGYIYYFDKNSVMESFDNKANAIINRSDRILKNTFEIKSGVEWFATKKLTFSMGYQFSKLDPCENYQTDISHSITNLSSGLGFAYKLNDRIKFNVGGLMTFYETFNKNYIHNNKSYTRNYDRTSKALAVGVDFRL